MVTGKPIRKTLLRFTGARGPKGSGPACGCVLRRAAYVAAPPRLVLLLTNLLAIALAGQCFFHPPLLARLEIKGMALDLFDDVFRLDLALETTQRIFQRLAFL